MSTSLYIFTNDLRLRDNPGLNWAAQSEKLHLATIIEPRWFKPSRYQTKPMGKLRWEFLWQAIRDLSEQLKSFDQVLTLRFGPWEQQLVNLLDETKATSLVLCRPPSVDERQQLQRVKALRPDVRVILVDSATLFSVDQANWLTEQLPKQFTPFRQQAEQLTPPPPLIKPTSLPPVAKMLKPDLQLPDWVPTATGEVSHAFAGGETSALNHLHRYFASTAPLSYKQTRDELSGWFNTSKFSPWLNQGSLSVREVWYSITRYEEEQGNNDSTYWHYFELLWREYFQWLALQLGPTLFSFQGTAKRKPLTSHYGQRLQTWTQGNTNFPLVNAIMVELNQTGYISNRSRQIVASCLVNELEIDWRYGAAWFEQQLLDYNVGSNWGNWQYIAGVGADPRGGRHFNIIKQQSLYDPNQEYIRQWLGEHPTADGQPPLGDSVDAADWPIDMK